MSEKNIIKNGDYRKWIEDIKLKVRQSQIKAAIKVNTELLSLYWYLGEMLISKQEKSKWGDGIIEQISKDLMSEFPEIKGFSRTNLLYIKKWVNFYLKIESAILQQLVAELKTKVPQLVGQLQTTGNMNFTIVPQPVGQLQVTEKTKFTKLPQVVAEMQFVQQLVVLIPWGHNREIISKCKDAAEALFYVIETINNGWSRSVLVHQIESDLYNRKSKAVTNFEQALPKTQSDLAKEIIKDPYIFDFLTLSEKADERDLENALVENLTKFLIELGQGFAYAGRQYHLEVSKKDFYIDLLFYHTKLHCYVAFELKTGEFKPEYAGKINFYLSALDDMLKSKEDNPSIGIILCKTKDKIIAEYALRDMCKPIGVADYKLTASLPKELKGKLPTAEELEEGLK